jgi:hypothetical protein
MMWLQFLNPVDPRTMSLEEVTEGVRGALYVEQWETGPNFFSYEQCKDIALVRFAVAAVARVPVEAHAAAHADVLMCACDAASVAVEGSESAAAARVTIDCRARAVPRRH